MRKWLYTIFLLFLISSCKHKRNFSEQLMDSLSERVKKIDPLATLDSLHILGQAPVNQRLGIIVDDSVYRREFMRIQARYFLAKQANVKDSIALYEYEMNNLEKGMDSITKSINAGDTTHNFGYLVECAYSISKNNKSKTDSTLVFIDTNSNLRYTEFTDSSLKRTIQMLP